MIILILICFLLSLNSLSWNILIQMRILNRCQQIPFHWNMVLNEQNPLWCIHLLCHWTSKFWPRLREIEESWQKTCSIDVVPLLYNSWLLDIVELEHWKLSQIQVMVKFKQSFFILISYFFQVLQAMVTFLQLLLALFRPQVAFFNSLELKSMKGFQLP